MSKEPLLTIAVPTYNGARTIRDMLDILLPQITDEVEVMISDNCSTDDTPTIVEEYKKKYPFIKYIRNKENLGADGNFLQCMRLANGKFTMLMSDDDIVVENGIDCILMFLKKYQSVSLAYLETIGFKDKYIDIDYCHEYKTQMRKIKQDVITSDKKVFFDYVRRQWGFTSSFIWNTERSKSIENIEKYCGTYWLQSYIHILCSNRKNDLLGVIKGPCIAAGEYGIINNYDLTEVEGKYFKDMLDFAIRDAGYDKQQLEKYWVWKVCYLGFRSVVLEKCIGKNVTSQKKLYDIMKNYPYAWVKLFPVFLLPRQICRLFLSILRKVQGRKFLTYVNRPTNN